MKLIHISKKFPGEIFSNILNFKFIARVKIPFLNYLYIYFFLNICKYVFFTLNLKDTILNHPLVADVGVVGVSSPVDGDGDVPK